ncbi:MAG: M23 family metallopeptidase [Bacteroidales bacterium]|nr:M23 family metallopeptidase [Bacteroidales bacterium]MBQ5882157.1 M23 family metallopeptidase [Bacteroidales bacterium]
MKHIISVASLILISFVCCAQNEAYEQFRKNRTQEQNQFVAQRQAEYEKFKKEYYTAFEKYKKLYTDYINEEISVIDLMVYDDGIPIKPLEKGVKQPEIVTSAKDQKKILKSSIKALSDLTPEQVLNSLSSDEDSVAQMAEAAKMMEQIVKSMESDNGQPVEVLPMTSAGNEVILEPFTPEDYAKWKEQLDMQNEVVQSQAQQEVPVVKEEPKKEEPKKKEVAEKDKNRVVEGVQLQEVKLQVNEKEQKKEQKEDEEEKPIFSYTEQGIKSNIPSGKPTQYTRISSPFGTRIHPITRKKHTHKGIDMAAPRMTPIYATADATVTFAAYNGGYGNFVKLNHENGYKTAYAHMHKIAVKNGDKIKKGDLVGYVGTTGSSTGNHLHYEVYYKDQLVDPATTL